MDEYYFSVNLDGNRKLCLAPLTDRLIAASGMDLPDTSGHFLFEQNGADERTTIEILAQVLSPEAVLKLRETFKMT